MIVPESSTPLPRPLYRLQALLARDTALRSTVIKEQLLVAPAGSPAASGDAPASSGSVHVPASLSRLSEGEPPLGMAGLAAATAAANDRLASLEREVDRLRAALEKTRAELSSALAVAAEPSHTAAVDALAPPSVSSNMAMPLSVQNLPGDDGASAWPPLEDVSKPPGVDGAAGVDRGTGYEAFIGISGEPPSEKSMAPPPAAAAWTWLLGTPPPSSPSNSQAFAYPGSTGGDASRMQGANAAAFEPGPGAQWRYGRGGEDSSGGDGGSSKNVGAFSPPPKPTLSAAAEAQLSGSWIPYSIGRGGAWERSGTAPMATAAESRWTPPAPLQPSYYGGPSLPASPAPSSPAAASSTTTAESGAPARRRWRYRRYLNAPDGGGGDAAAGQGGGGALGGPASAGGLGGGGGGSPSEGEGREGGGAPGSSGGASEGRGEWHGSDSAGGYRWWL